MSLVGFNTLTKREIIRFLKVPIQTVFPSLISAVLYILIFGFALGDRLGELIEVSYAAFIVPGLVMMSLITNAYTNTSSSIYISRFLNHMQEVLVSPISYFEMVLAYTIGGVMRGLIVGVGVYSIALFFVRSPIHNPFIILYFLILVSAIFSSIGVIIGLWAETFEQMSLLMTFVITPLIFFGGVFHSIAVVPAFLRIITVANPIFYMVDGLRYGFLGIHDGNLLFSMALVAVLALFLFILTVYLFKKGYKLRS